MKVIIIRNLFLYTTLMIVSFVIKKVEIGLVFMAIVLIQIYLLYRHWNDYKLSKTDEIALSMGIELSPKAKKKHFEKVRSYIAEKQDKKRQIQDYADYIEDEFDEADIDNELEKIEEEENEQEE